MSPARPVQPGSAQPPGVLTPGVAEPPGPNERSHAGHLTAGTTDTGTVAPGARVRGRPARSAVRAAVRECLADLDPGDRVVVALSGGPDSLALLAGALRVAATMGLIVEVVVVDHQLQPGSSWVAQRAAGQARRLGCRDVRVVAVDVARGPGEGGPEAAARKARYAALGAAAEPGPAAAGSPGARRRAVVLLGHTRDDQAETVLLALARGSGTRSLAGMAVRSGIYRRPLLHLPREVVRRAAAEAAASDPGLDPWADPHNEDRAHTRARVRADLVPALEAALGPGVAAALARTADLARDDADALDAWADGVWAGIAAGATPPAGDLRDPDPAAPAGLVGRAMWRLDAAALGAAPGPRGPIPRAVATRVVRRFLLAAGCPAGSLTAEHVWAVSGLALRAGPVVALPGGLHARREGGDIVVRA